MNNNNKNLLKDIVVNQNNFKRKIKIIKLNNINRTNILGDTFQPITKPLNHIIKKLESNNKKK